MAINRYLGFVADATVGGTPRDNLTGAPPLALTGTPTIPDPDKWFPVTSVAAVDKGNEVIDRKNEMRNSRGNPPALAFRQAPSIEVEGKLYPYVLKKLTQLATGGVDAKTGTPPAAITHKLEPVAFGAEGISACHIHVVRDDLREVVCGCQLAELELNFPIDGEATWKGTFAGLYRRRLTGSPPAASFAAVVPDWVYILRDARALLDASVTPVPRLRGYNMKFSNEFRDPDFDPLTNREDKTISSVLHRTWWPARRRLGASTAISGQLQLSNVNVTEEDNRDFSHAQQLVVEVEAQDLGTTPAAKEMLRVTHGKIRYTDGGASEMTRQGDIQSEYNFEVGLDPATGKDLTFEFVDATNTLIAF